MWLELSGLMAIVGYVIGLAGAIGTTGTDDTVESVGDFFSNSGSFAALLSPLLIVGLLLLASPRLFYRWSGPLPAVTLGVGFVLGCLAGVVGAVVTVGAAVTEWGRATDGASDSNAASALLVSGLAIGTLSALTLLPAILEASRQDRQSRPRVEPLT
jgi:hypothetical protein